MLELSLRQWAVAFGGAIAFNAVGLLLLIVINEHISPGSSSTREKVEALHFQEQREKKRRPRPDHPKVRVRSRQARLPLPSLPSAMSATGLGLTLTDEADLFSDMLGRGAGIDGSIILKEDAVDVPPKVIARVAPEYPRSAEEREIEGYVLLKLQVSQQGHVERVWILASEPPGVFDAVAERAVRQFRFSPARYHGAAVPVLATQKLLFRLGG